MLTEHKLGFNDVCKKLGQQPQFLFELAWSASAMYDTFDMPKRRGGFRTISSPKDTLKRIQRSILKGLLEPYPMPPHVHGGVKNRSIVTNANGHQEQPLVIHIDLSNFFGTISAARVKELFLNQLNMDEHAADAFTRLTTYGNFLPQGAPTSPTLANIIALPLDEALIEICRSCQSSHAFHYSRYIDDITISGGVELAFEIGAIHAAIEAHGFYSNPRKLGFAKPSMRQKVTGVVVNRKLNVPKSTVRRLRQQLYYWKKFGLTAHCERINIKPEFFIQQMHGLVAYVRMIRPELGDELAHQLFSLVGFAVQTFEVSEQELMLLLLRNAIENGDMITFTYGQTQIKAAPSTFEWDSDSEKAIRAFVLQPYQRWETFEVDKMSALQLATLPPEDNNKESPTQ